MSDLKYGGKTAAQWRDLRRSIIDGRDNAAEDRRVHPDTVRMFDLDARLFELMAERAELDDVNPHAATSLLMKFLEHSTWRAAHVAKMLEEPK